MQIFFYETSLSVSPATVAAYVRVSFVSWLLSVHATVSHGSDDCYMLLRFMFQVFIVEEIGLVSAELFAVMDLVLRRLRESPVPFGGIFLLGSGDPLQLPPVQGMPIWCSCHLLTTFRVFMLHEYVRCAVDADLRRLISIMRILNVTDEETTEFCAIITRRCGRHNFIPHWDDVPPAVLRILPTKKAVATAVADYLRRKRADPALVSATFAASDQVESSAGNWVTANEQCVRHLNRTCAEEHELFLYVGAVMRLTFNNTNPAVAPRFSQGQLCVVNSLPHDLQAITDRQRQRQRVNITLIPAGQRILAPGNINPNWPTCDLSRRFSAAATVGRGYTKGRRHQWPLQYYVASTIHKVVGDTCDHLATQISAIDRRYKLWDRSMLLVLLSRVRNLANITFVGDLPATLLAMTSLLQQKCRSTAVVMRTLQGLDVIGQADRVVENAYVQLQQEIPNYDVGFVYMLASSRQPLTAYVGETSNIRRRLTQHNSGYGAHFTEDALCRPWCLYVLVVGFPGVGTSPENTQARRNLERQWHMAMAAIPHRLRDTNSIYAAGLEVFHAYQTRHRMPDLRFLQCGRLRATVP